MLVVKDGQRPGLETAIASNMALPDGSGLKRSTTKITLFYDDDTYQSRRTKMMQCVNLTETLIVCTADPLHSQIPRTGV